MILDCLESVNGISAAPCKCDGVEALESLSGNYLDDMEYGIPIKWANKSIDCEDEDGILKICQRALTEGAHDFVTEFSNYLHSKNQLTVKNAKDQIGKLKNNTGINGALKNHIGFVLEGQNYYGSLLHIKRGSIHVVTAIYEDVDLYIYSADDLTTHKHKVTVKLNGKFQDFNIFLPLSDSSGFKTYIFTYDPLEMVPLNNELDCGCGNAGKDWEKYIKVSGYNVEGLVDVELGSNVLAYGIRLDIEITCDNVSWLCVNEGYWKSKGYYRTVAKCLLFFQISRLCNYILKSDNLNRYTLLGREALYGRRNNCRSNAEKYLEFLASKIEEVEETNCFICRPKTFISKSPIYVRR